jgi:hypothetical protein
MTSRSRRRTRLRSTALPTCFETVKPMRGGPASKRVRACRTKALAGARAPVAAARKSVRRFNRSMSPTLKPILQTRARVLRDPFAADLKRSVSCALGRDARTEPCGRPWSPSGHGSRDGAYAPICSADRSVSREFLRYAPSFMGAARFARLIREPRQSVNVTSPLFSGLLPAVYRPSRGLPRPPFPCIEGGQNRGDGVANRYRVRQG